MRVGVCPSCRHENQPGAKFCSECGVAMVAAEPTAHEERKVVTVLFAGLVGFTFQAEMMDPEASTRTGRPPSSRIGSRTPRPA